MKIVVTGSAGFIGHHLCMRLLSEGHEVVGVDNYEPYYDVRLKKFRTARLQDYANFHEINLDLSMKSETRAALAEVQPEVIIHLAAQAGVRYSLENPHAYTKANIDAFLNILETCRHQKVRRLVYASSSSVYGGIDELPFSENMDVSSPISLYAATKKANELMAHTYTHLYNFETVGLRFFTVYGPMGRPDMAMWLFTDAILNNRPIKVFNHGKMKRDFTYVEDIISGVFGAMSCALPEPCRVYNLGNHRCEELERLIGLLEKNLGREAIRENLPMQPGDVPATFADTKRAMAELNFDPSTTLDTGVEKFTSWYLHEWLPHIEKQYA